MPVLDAFGRPLRDLRISVTDRCNFRCTYCMPKKVFGKDYRFLDRKELLTFEEITRVARRVGRARRREAPPDRRRAAAARRHRAADRRCSRRSTVDLTLTTNGSPLPEEGAGAQGRGPEAHHGQPRLARRRHLPGDERRRLPGRRACSRGSRPRRRSGMPVKVNCVVKRGVNEHQIVQLARHFKGTGDTLRFIEFMDVGATNGWRMDDVVPAAEIVAHARRGVRRRAGRRALPRRGRQALALQGRHRRDRHHRLGHAAVLRRLHPRRGSRPRASSTPACSRRGPRPARARPRRRHRRGARATSCARSGAAAATATPSSAPRTPSTLRSASARSRCRYIGG